MKMYREVKASERLPDREDLYRVVDFLHGEFTERLYAPGDKTTDKFWTKYVEYWLEPIEITEEEIEEIIKEWDYDTAHVAAKTILSKLKGE